jgi:hypothetical protein
MCLNGTHSNACFSEYLYEPFPIQNGLKQGHASSPSLSDFAIEYAIRNIQENKAELGLSGVHHRLIHANGIKRRNTQKLY